ncbi:MAG: Gfo/Idh/MocA family oxidoreductase, partial [Clostridia bacterium]|nr:Gfo/Idh/MocA family oxidoreductase [Clostridia bacterium]
MQRTVVIGMGHIGHRHAQAYTESDKAQLVAVCDRVPELAQKAGEKFGVPYFTSAKEMLAAMQPNMASVTTGGYEYASDHYEPTMQALRAGCHVLGEKPISNDLRHAQEMVDLAEKMGV